MAAFGFTLNNLSLFGLVLAIGIVVDDAIVVVENVERNIAAGLAPREAAQESMDEVGSALIAIALVLCAVFVPSMFITGISGQFYRQFALTIAGATVISLIVSLTLVAGDVRAVAQAARAPSIATPGGSGRSTGFFGYFNRGFDKIGGGISWLADADGAPRRRHGGDLSGRYRLRPECVPHDARRLYPAGRRRLYHYRCRNCRPGASLARTDEVQQRVLGHRLSVPGVAHAVNIVGFSGATFTNAPNSGALFLMLDPFDERATIRTSRRRLFKPS